MIDTHCHLTHKKFDDDRDAAVVRAAAAGVSRCITIGTGIEDARACLALAARHPDRVSATAGLDPFTAHAAGPRFDLELARLAELLDGGGFVALGEVGLDYHYDLSPRPVQAEQLHAQLALAEARDLPVVIHVRDAHEDMAGLLAEHPQSRGVIHSFTGGPVEAERYLALGWYLAFNGVATFKGAPEVREAARSAPPERILLETDSPYLAPVPLRGKRCEPSFVAHTLARLAEVRSESVADLDRVTTRNAERLFGV